ncbi:MAG: (Fe-S)-binding protein [Deltaproteobacteria bacterium]|nr:(Fe-S)-binding protein [Deltaproteobacteria bacterium]
MKEIDNKNTDLKVEDFSKDSDRLLELTNDDLMPLPEPLDDKAKSEPPWKPLSDSAKEKYESDLDNTLLLNIPKPKSKEEEKKYIKQFLQGLEKLFTKENNWVFLQPFKLTMEHCTKCHTCSEACHIFQASGRAELYRPTYRTEILRRIYFKYLKPGGRFFGRWQHGDIDLNWKTVARLAELSYRCNLCRRCAQACPIGCDNGLVAREIRKLFSQELGWATKELHEKGSMQQLRVGSSTGMNPEVVKDNMDFIDEDASDITGMDIKTPWDVQGADILLIHNAGEILSWPENPAAFAVILQAAGISWTLSSEALGYDSVNYGLFYDDAMLAKVVIKHALAAKKLGVKKIVFGECGHAHKALTIIADRILTGDLNIPRESSMPLLRDIVMSGKLKLDPSRNDFPVTLHDPCNMVRMMGIVEPQREVLRKIAPRFREMTPHGVNNYCCGGGSGFAIHSGHNFVDWRMKVSGRMKMKQILEAFKGEDSSSETYKYICAPCSNCKGQFRDILEYYGLTENNGIHYGGLVELIVNAMTDVKPGFIRAWEQ